MQMDGAGMHMPHACVSGCSTCSHDDRVSPTTEWNGFGVHRFKAEVFGRGLVAEERSALKTTGVSGNIRFVPYQKVEVGG